MFFRLAPRLRKLLARACCSLVGLLPSLLWAGGSDELDSKIGYHLGRIMEARKEIRSPEGLSAGVEPMLRKTLNSAAVAGVVAEVQIQAGPANTEQLIRETGAVVRHFNAERGWASLELPVAVDLQALSELPFVTSLRYSPPPIFRVGSVTSRAATAMRATAVSDSFLLDGAGLKIGIISDSFANSSTAEPSGVRDADTTPSRGQSGTLRNSTPQDSGDLPAAITLLNDATEGVDEGAAMAELIHDIAPGAEIYFHSAGQSRVEMAAAIDALCDAGVDVIVDDVLFLLEMVYQDDKVAIAAENCIEKGVSYFSAAGNDGNYGHQYTYRDINAEDDQLSVPSGNDLHNWSSSGTDGFMRLDVPAGQGLYIILNWNQPGDGVSPLKGSEIDLDLYVTRVASTAALVPGSSNLVERGVQRQGSTGNPRGEPVEFVYLETGASAQTYYIAVEHRSGSQTTIPQNSATPLEFSLLYTGGTISQVEYPFNGRTTWGHVLGEGVMGIAAVPWWESPEFEPRRFTSIHIDPEPFTAVGGVQLVQFDDGGDYLAQQRTVPQFAAVDGNNNTFLGSPSASVAPISGEPDSFPNFFGTSAAAPNAAAVYLLMKQAFPELTPAVFLQQAQSTAVDVNGSQASTGFDDVTGSGLLDGGALYTALAQVYVDSDGDGISDMSDNCPNATNPSQQDTDADGLGDVCDSQDDTDTDLDGIRDEIDNCPDLANSNQADKDQDGVGDACDPVDDSDGDNDADSVRNSVDNCPDIANANQGDIDGDGLGDACDPQDDRDQDGDGVRDEIDNCPTDANSNQTDSDSDGSGDVCDSTPIPASSSSGGGGGAGLGLMLLVLISGLLGKSRYLQR